MTNNPHYAVIKSCLGMSTGLDKVPHNYKIGREKSLSGCTQGSDMSSLYNFMWIMCK